MTAEPDRRAVCGHIDYRDGYCATMTCWNYYSKQAGRPTIPNRVTVLPSVAAFGAVVDTFITENMNDFEYLCDVLEITPVTLTHKLLTTGLKITADEAIPHPEEASKDAE